MEIKKSTWHYKFRRKWYITIGKNYNNDCNLIKYILEVIIYLPILEIVINIIEIIISMFDFIFNKQVSFVEDDNNKKNGKR